MRISKIFILPAFLFVCCFSQCTTETVSDPQQIRIAYYHPVAPSGHAVIYLDGSTYPFAENFDYGEYFAGDDLKKEFGYYLKKGFQSFLNIDLNADSQYVQVFLLDSKAQPGVYDMKDTELSKIAKISFELQDSLDTATDLKLQSGSLQITRSDAAAKRISGVFTCTVQSSKTKVKHLVECSFTDIFFRNGVSGGEVLSADISGNNWSSKFSSHTFCDGFGNNNGQGIKGEDYFAVVAATDADSVSGYDALTFYFRKPVHAGTFDIEPGNAICSRYSFDRASSSYVLKEADSNAVRIPQAITVTDYDVVRRRVSGTFNFTITDNSPRSPVVVSNGKFIDLFWW